MKTNKNDSVKKPSIGLRPKWVVDDARKTEILAAIIRYEEAGKEIPTEWTTELRDLERIEAPNEDIFLIRLLLKDSAKNTDTLLKKH
jgi:hypothetical protein